MCVTALTHVAPARAAVPLVPRRVFSTNPSFVNAVISPDGKTLAYLARSKGGTMNLWVRSLDGGEQHVVSKDSDGDLFGAQWAADSRHLLFVHDTNGDENYHLKSLDIVTRQLCDLTPFNGVRASVEAAGKGSWSKLDAAIDRVEKARATGQRVTADMYVYTASATGLDVSMPPWALEGGYAAWASRLRDPAIRSTR